MSDKRIVVAIDGPAGAGKSTIAKRVATRLLWYVYINSGAMYRPISLWALRLGTDLTDMHRLEQLAREARIDLAADDGVALNGEDVTKAIREPAVSEAASRVSAVPGVRRAMLGLQRAIAEESSVVFPSAQVKIFLDADPHERARRRSAELRAAGGDSDVQTVARQMEERDGRDRQRAEAPLVQAPDAELVDTTGLTLEQVEEAVLKIVRARTSNGKAAAS